MSAKLKKLRIALVCDDSLDKTDGVQQYVITLGAWLSNNGHEVHYITSETHREDLTNVHSVSKNVGFNFNSNRGGMPLFASPARVQTLLKECQFDLIHIQMPYSPLLAGQIIHFLPNNTALVGTFHIFPESKVVAIGTKALGLVVRQQLKKFHEIISVSSAAQSFATESFGVHTLVIPNMVNLAAFKPGQQNPRNKDKIKIVFLGRLVPRKGCMELLKALVFLKANYTIGNPYEVYIGGKGPLLEGLIKYSEKNNLVNIVKFLGFIPEDDKVALLASADIAVFPSTGGESFGISLIEAMAASPGVVIAGDNPGYRTVMEGSHNQLVDSRQAQDFAHLLATYIDDATRRHKAHMWQKERVKLFDVDVVGRQILETYYHALQKSRK